MGITPGHRPALSRCFGTSAEFWIGIQQEFGLLAARAEIGTDIESQIKPLVV